jgi:hypothetical protein
MGAKRTPGTGNPTSDLSNLCLAITEHAPLPIATVERAGHIVRALCHPLLPPDGSAHASRQPEGARDRTDTGSQRG